MEGPGNAKSPIDNPSIEKSKKRKVPLEGEEEIRITLKANLCKNINGLQAQGYKVDDDNESINDNIKNLASQRYNPTYNPCYGIVMIVENHQ